MAKTKQVNTMITQEEEQELSEYIKQQIMSTGQVVTKASVARDALLKYIRNGKPDDEHVDDKQEPTKLPPETPSTNPFSDIKI